VQTILGEALTAAVLLATTIKYKGSLILQIRGDGPIHLLVIQVSDRGKVRGLARWSKEPNAKQLAAIFGQGQMAITLQNDQTNERYQSIIPLEGDSLSMALEAYFMRSEQLATRLWLSSNNHSAAGLLVQRLPQTLSTKEDWQRVSTLLDTTTSRELLHLEPEELLYRLFHEEQARLFEAKPIEFACSCSLNKVETMLRSLGKDEVKAIVQEQGNIGVTCEFCNTDYRLDAIDAERLFKDVLPNHPTLQ
jgi:molecular chaperone Hsp33